MQKLLKCLLFLPLILFSFKGNSQNAVDSLQQKTYEELRALFSNLRSDTLKSAYIANYYLIKAKRESNIPKIAKGYHLLYYSFSDHTVKQKYVDSIIDITRYNQSREFPALAYLHKAQFHLYQNREITKTINNLNAARKYANQNDNIDLIYRVDYMIGIIKSEHLDEKEEALNIYKKCAKFYQTKKQDIYKSRYINTLHAIAETYIALKEHDSSSYYNELGYQEAENHENVFLQRQKVYFTLCEGVNHYSKNNFRRAIDSIHKALPEMISINDVSNTLDCYYYLGKSYFDLGQNKKALPYLIKTDSILESLNSIPQYKHVKIYQYLKNYYRNINDLENQNKYLDKLNKILANYLSDQIHISKKVKEDYDIALLIEEQESVVKKLNRNTDVYKSGVLLLILLLLISSSVLLYQYRKKQVYRKRFQEILTKQKTSISKEDEEFIKSKVSESNIKVPQKHVDYILERLDQFEKEKKYLATGISSQSLADDFDTNVKYLSRVINHFKNKSFTNYLNELRISFAIEELKTNTTLRKFTIKAIANEMGYNSAETFSNAFYKQTKIKPSYYIKNLNKQ
ncbi:helix-turn-helix domain-containing protein [Aquimarina spongiae]|uniref:Helix-turn-helix domain-containing protein n=1 Tax=Aquimarina spongiae TaxID=570521 RepID=A0A1M6BHS8_9FLAO|nr:helix-turn-helix domain-containing protein [Aquimarina spongiae]SHI48284.1 Helix-turn-helix domain-containing protein [Aquimarina spongiae]